MKIFISYSHKDFEYKDLLLDKLKGMPDVTVAVDEKFLRGGADFYSRIYNEIITADYFIAILTQNYLDSKFCVAESQEAKRNSVPICVMSLGVLSHNIQAFVREYSSGLAHKNFLSSSDIMNVDIKAFLKSSFSRIK